MSDKPKESVSPAGAAASLAGARMFEAGVLQGFAKPDLPWPDSDTHYTRGLRLGQTLARSRLEPARQDMIKSFARSASFAVCSLWQAHTDNTLTEEQSAAFGQLMFKFFLDVSDKLRQEEIALLIRHCRTAVGRRVRYRGRNGDERDKAHHGQAVQGEGMCLSHHDSHGPRIMVGHDDGTEVCVDLDRAGDLEILSSRG